MADYLETICPHCYEFSEYKPNPVYLHKCGSCKKTYNNSHLITVVDANKVIGEINRLTWLLTEYATKETTVRTLKGGVSNDDVKGHSKK